MTASPTHSDADFADAMDGSEASRLSSVVDNGQQQTAIGGDGEEQTETAPTSSPSQSARTSARASNQSGSSRHARSSASSSSPSRNRATSGMDHASRTSPPGKTAPGVAALLARFQTSSSSSSSSLASPPPCKPPSTVDVPPPTEPSGNKDIDQRETSDSETDAPLPSLPADEEKIPPSEGAISLLDPDTTIANPFSSDDPSSSSHASDSRSPPTTPRPHAPYLPHLADQGEGSASRTASPAQNLHNMSPRSAARFSEISLSSGGLARSSYTGGGTSAASSRRSSKRATMMAFGESDTLASQLEESKRFSSQPEASSEGMEKLRENFEKLHQQQQQKQQSRSRQQSQATDVSATGLTMPSPLREEVRAASDGDGDGEGDANTRGDGSAETILTPSDSEYIEEVDWDFWGRVMSNYQEVAQENPRDLSRAIQSGIPGQLRGLCWQLLSASKDEEMEIIYAYYIRQSSSHEKQIRKDLSRTFPDQDYFKDGKGVGQENLFNVVKAYSLYDEECGYCQGMQFIVGPLLMHMPDEEAFSTLVRLMKSYGLRGHFVPNMPGLQLRLFQFDRLLEDMLPLLHRHLTRQGVKASMYASQWFMTLFSYRFPLDFVYRILDSVFAEGLEAVFRFAVSLMSKSEDALIELNFEQTLAYLKGPAVVDVYRLPDGEYDVDAFARDAFAIQVTPYMLDGYATEFEDSVRAANAHRREVEALRLVNRNLAARVASLEEQLQQINAEHVDLVKDAVMSKVAKEEMEEDLIRYKMLFAEASLRADQAGEGNRSSYNSLS